MEKKIKVCCDLDLDRTMPNVELVRLTHGHEYFIVDKPQPQKDQTCFENDKQRL